MGSINQKSRFLCCFLTMCVPTILATGCARQPGSDSKMDSSLTPVSVQLNWYPEVEHGGVYQSLIDGAFAETGLNVEIRPGGRETPVAPELLRGRSQFAITNADDVVLFREQGADIVAVLAAVQNHPRCLLVRTDSGVESFDDLAGMTLQCQPGRAFLPFLRTRGYLEGVREVPYFNSIAAMVNDPKIMVQAYSVAEPLIAQQQGLDVRLLMISDLGWNPYSSVLVTTGTMIRESPDVVRKMVDATRAGWIRYLDNPESTNAAILQANGHSITAEALRFGSEAMLPLVYPDALSVADITDSQRDQFGQMSETRWKTLLDQMVELELVDPNRMSASDCFTNEFLTR